MVCKPNRNVEMNLTLMKNREDPIEGMMKTAKVEPAGAGCTILSL